MEDQAATKETVESLNRRGFAELIVRSDNEPTMLPFRDAVIRTEGTFWCQSNRASSTMILRHGGVQRCGGKLRRRQTGWMKMRGRQFVLTLRQEGYIKKPAGFFLAQDVLFAVEACHATSCGGEMLGAHQRELMKEFGENCVEFSEAEHHAKVRADKQAAPVELIKRQTDTRALPSTEREWEDALHVLAKPTSGRACGPDAISLELIAAGGQGYRRCPEKELRFFGKVATWRPSLAKQGHSRRAIREECVVFQLPRKSCMPVCHEQQRYLGSPCQLACRKRERFEAEERNSRS